MILQNQKLDIIFVHFSVSQKSLGKKNTPIYIINGFTYLKKTKNLNKYKEYIKLCMFYKIGLIYTPLNIHVDEFINSPCFENHQIGCGYDAKFYTRKLNIPCFMIFRSPINLFGDVYRHEYTKKEGYRQIPHLQNINNFVLHVYKMYKSGQSYMYQHKNDKYNICLNQTELLNGTSGRSFLLRENSDVNAIVKFLNTVFHLKIDNIESITKKCEVITHELSKESLVMLNDIYKKDFIVYNRLTKQKKLYVRLSSI
jgi:hypothetical protein